MRYLVAFFLLCSVAAADVIYSNSFESPANPGVTYNFPTEYIDSAGNDMFIRTNSNLNPSNFGGSIPTNINGSIWIAGRDIESPATGSPPIGGPKTNLIWTETFDASGYSNYQVRISLMTSLGDYETDDGIWLYAANTSSDTNAWFDPTNLIGIVTGANPNQDRLLKGGVGGGQGTTNYFTEFVFDVTNLVDESNMVLGFNTMINFSTENIGIDQWVLTGDAIPEPPPVTNLVWTVGGKAVTIGGKFVITEN